MAIILGSQSPRRRELLEKLDLPFTILTADIDETVRPELTPAQAVADISARKAAAILRQASEDDLVITADTIVVLDGQIMGKPHSPEEAEQMLSSLSGRTHQVYTAVTLHSHARQKTEVACTQVTFRPLDPTEIRAYIASGEPMDKAGAYGIQGRGAVLVSHLEGDYFNVMGLPLCTLCRMLRSFGVKILGV